MTDEERKAFAEKSDAEWRAERDAEREARHVAYLRDRFAGQAMMGLNAAEWCKEISPHDLAVYAYRCADAMLEARKA